MKKFKLACILTFLLIFVIHHPSAQSEVDVLSKSRYSDPKGYFKIVPPDGWEIQQYLKDPRGKVAFLGSDDVEIRILTKGLDYNQFDVMFEGIKEKEKQLKINTHIEKIVFLDNQAIKRTFTIKGHKMLFIDFMLGQTAHNLMYVAPPKYFDKYLSLAQKSLNTYEPALLDVSPEDIKKHDIAKSIRLSQVFFEQKNYDLSLEYIKEGLNLEPNNVELIELKKTILDSTNKLKKKRNSRK